jgi:predicted metal-dependent phosphoesterase TrpH
MIVDLHCHSTCSDGSLSPLQLIEKAKESSIELFAITDHDTIQAYKEIDDVADLNLISGIELSTSWNKIGVHIVGLDFDLNAQAMQQTISLQNNARHQRAEVISNRMERFGLKNAYEKIIESKENIQHIGRPDFADLLVSEGIVKDASQAFKKILGAGKVGDVKSQWLGLEEIISAIKTSGGRAVIAHPLHYKLTNTKLSRLVEDFKSLGGDGIEVISGFQNRDKLKHLIQLCTKFDLAASVGSDFHRPTTWNHLGCQTHRVQGCEKIWDYFD